MKVFLTGATGFIGSAIMSKLISSGHQVTGLVQSKENKEKVKAAGGTPILGDLLVPGPWKEAVQDHDVVISASSPFKITDKLSIDEAKRRGRAHTEMVTNLINAAAHVSKVQAVVLTYHVTAFGSHGDGWVSEVMPVEARRTCHPDSRRVLGYRESGAEGGGAHNRGISRLGLRAGELVFGVPRRGSHERYACSGRAGAELQEPHPYRRPGGRIPAYPGQDAGRRAVLFRGFPSRTAKGVSRLGQPRNLGNGSRCPQTIRCSRSSTARCWHRPWTPPSG